MCLEQHNKPVCTQIFIWWNESKQATTEREQDGIWNVTVFILYYIVRWHLREELVISIPKYATLFYEDLKESPPAAMVKTQVEVLVITPSSNEKKTDHKTPPVKNFCFPLSTLQIPVNISGFANLSYIRTEHFKVYDSLI